MLSVHSAELVFADDTGRNWATMTIFAPEPQSVNLLDETESQEFSEERIQLWEEQTYEYELSFPSGEFALEPREIIQPSKNPRRASREGVIKLGATAGLLQLSLIREGRVFAVAAVEIVSTKLDYREDYRKMVDFISERCTDLLLDWRSPAALRLRTESTDGIQTMQQKFMFLRSALDSSKFSSAIQRILTSPHNRGAHDTKRASVARGFRATRAIQRQLSQSYPRIPVPAGHPLFTRMKSIRGMGSPTLPANVAVPCLVDTVDTTENRFVKFALTSFDAFLSNTSDRLMKLRGATAARLSLQLNTLRKRLGVALAHDLFTMVGEADLLPLGSPVLQRRGGYREILQMWLGFQMLAHITWEGGEDVFGGGKKDTAKLYEYWLYFVLRDLFTRKFGLPQIDFAELLEENADGFGLKLKAGRAQSVSGIWRTETRDVNVRFSYNRMFSANVDFHLGGSWTKHMRPDFTLSMWPYGLTEGCAEEQDILIHLHFDAKYKAEQLTSLFGQDDQADSLVEREDTTDKETYKRSDLLKMHAYRDAIRRSEGAYVLYPGTEEFSRTAYREILPGLGAFPVKPGPNGDAEDINVLASFVDDVGQHFLNRLSDREVLSFQQYSLFSRPKPDELQTRIPEVIGRSLKRHPPASRIGVVIARYGSPDELLWAQSHSIFPVSLSAGMPVSIFNAIDIYYLVLIGTSPPSYGGAWLVTSNPVLSSANEIAASGFPAKTAAPLYIAFTCTPIVEDFLKPHVTMDDYARHLGVNNVFEVIPLDQLLRPKNPSDKQ